MERIALKNGADVEKYGAKAEASDATPSRQAGALQAIILVFTTQLPIMGIISIVPIIPLLIQHFSAHPQVAMLIPLMIAAPSLCIALLSPLAGFLADRVGRRRLLLIAVLLYSVFGFLPFVLDDLPTIIATRFCLGVCEAFIMTIANTLMGDLFQAQTRKKWLAVQSAVGSVSATTLLFIAGMLGSYGWQGPFALYLLALPMFLLLLTCTWEPTPLVGQHSEASGARFPLKIMLGICAVTLFCALLYYVEVLQISSVLSLSGLDSPAKIGFASGIAGIGVPIGALLFSLLSKRSLRLQLLINFALFAVGLYGMGNLGGITAVVSSAFVAQIGCGLLIPTLLTWCLSQLAYEHRGKGIGVWHTAFFLGQFLSPFVISILTMRSAGGLLAAVSSLGVLAAIGAMITAMTLRRRTT